MAAPAYLVRSRHGVFYLRWPLPPALHPRGKPSDVKLSLRTRDRREALRLSRLLRYIADKLISSAAQLIA